MPFDPTKPRDDTLGVASDLRDQFNALKALIDAKPSTDDMNAAISANSASNVDRIAPMSSGVSDPPTQEEVQQIYNTLNYLINALKH